MTTQFSDDDPYVDLPLFELPDLYGVCDSCGALTQNPDDLYCPECQADDSR